MEILDTAGTEQFSKSKAEMTPMRIKLIFCVPAAMRCELIIANA